MTDHLVRVESGSPRVAPVVLAVRTKISPTLSGGSPTGALDGSMRDPANVE